MTPSEAREQFCYTPTTGVVIFRKKRSHALACQPAGCKNSDGYIIIGKRRVLAHRVAWCLHYGDWPDGIIDHIDRDRTNNRIDNLRIASRAQNMHNSGEPVTNTTGVRGVSRFGKRFMARIGHNGAIVYLGVFDTVGAAKQARLKAEKTFWNGEVTCPAN
jgi:hypothetical protein